MERPKSDTLHTKLLLTRMSLQLGPGARSSSPPGTHARGDAPLSIPTSWITVNCPSFCCNKTPKASRSGLASVVTRKPSSQGPSTSHFCQRWTKLLPLSSPAPLPFSLSSPPIPAFFWPSLVDPLSSAKSQAIHSSLPSLPPRS